MNNTQLNNYPIINEPLYLEEIHILSGANYFSGDRVIRLRINLKQYDEVFTNEIPDFYNKLITAIPSIKQHHCSVGKEGGFLIRVQEGTLLGHVIEHIAIEMQILAGMDVGFGKTRMTKKQGVYNVVYRFVDEIAGIYAGIYAFNLVNCILTNKPFAIHKIIKKLVEIKQNRLLGFSTFEIVKEAEKRNIPWQRLDDYNLVQLGTGKFRKLIRATITEKTSLISVETTDNKHRTISILEEYGIYVPKTILINKPEDAISFYNEIKTPIVIKPSMGSAGNGISINLDNENKIKKAFERAAKFDDLILAQRYIPGKSYRIMVIDHRFVAALELEPPAISGDGVKTISELIDDMNSTRKNDEPPALEKFNITDDTLDLLSVYGMNLNTVLEKAKNLALCNSGNIRFGGRSKNVTDIVHTYNQKLFEHISKIMNLDVAGIDIISDDISVPLNQNNGKVIEINAAPDFLPHILPHEGNSVNVAESFVSMLFPDDDELRIPLFSVTGSHGCTLVLDILTYWLLEKGKNPGVVKDTGLYSGNHFLLKPIEEISVNEIKTMLKDPTLDFALCEIPVKSILHDGLAYKYADIGIVLNLDTEEPVYYTYDHIRDEKDLAYAAAVVAEEVEDEGFSILNGDDVNIAAMAERCYSKVVFFTQNPNQKHIKQHLNNDGITIVLQENEITIYHGKKSYPLMSLKDLPAAEISTPGFKDSILATTATMYSWGESINRIKEIFLGFFK